MGHIAPRPPVYLSVQGGGGGGSRPSTHLSELGEGAHAAVEPLLWWRGLEVLQDGHGQLRGHVIEHLAADGGK